MAGDTLIDTHCHLNDADAFPDPAEAVREAVEAGVARMIVVGIDTDSSRRAVELADRFEEVYAVVGWHPNHADDYRSEDLPAIGALLAHPKVVALGEIGLDYYRQHASRESQARCLNDQLNLAASLGAPVVFHCREAYGDLLDVLEARPRLKYLFHCFAGNEADAVRCRALDAWVGVDGPVTYPAADALRAVLRGFGHERIVIETDSPWMAPHPFRGKRNRPAWLPMINEGLASALAVSPGVCAARTTSAALGFFGRLGL